MTKRQFLVILYLLVGIIPLIAQTFTEQKKNYPISADGNKYVVSGFTPFSVKDEKPGRELTLVARKDYQWGPKNLPQQGPANLDGITFIVVWFIPQIEKLV